jgi:ATP-dependent Lon protease
MTNDLGEVYVFPLDDVVFYPKTTLPLNIFEPRYIQMINDSIERGTPIAVSPVDPTSPAAWRSASSVHQGIVAGYGTPYVFHHRVDGSMVVLLQGQGKIEIGEVLGTDPYLTCAASLVSEREDVDLRYTSDMDRLNRVLVRWVEKNVTEASQKDALLMSLTSPQRVLETLAMVGVMDSDIQQAILEMDDVNDRIRLMRFLF